MIKMGTAQIKMVQQVCRELFNFNSGLYYLLTFPGISVGMPLLISLPLIVPNMCKK